MKDEIKNLAFIDGQNLYMGTVKREAGSWKIDLSRFRIYLRQKYNVSEAYYFLGYMNEYNQELYNEIQKAGFIVMFKEHNEYVITKKKGNVDADVVFEIMRNLVDNKEFAKIVLVSGDGDYKKVVDYLISKKKFAKILFPNKKFASSLYRKFGSEYFDWLENPSIKEKIAAKMKKAP